MKRALILTLAILLLSAGSFAAVASASVSPSASSGTFSPKVQVPFYVYTGEHFNMYVNNSYGYSNYTVTVYFSGQNLAGFSPSNTYHNFTTSSPDFKIPMTAPGSPQKITLLVKSSADTSSGQKTFTSSYTVNVINPIYLHAAITNRNNVPMHNVTVNFYVDSNYVASKTVQNITPGQTEIVNYTWLNPYLSHGKHSIKVSVNNTLISVNGGGSSSTSSFYYGQPPNYNWIFYVVGAVAVFMAIMVMGAGRRPKVGEKKPKWRR